MLIPVQSFQKIIIGINQRNIDLLTMRYTTDAMHQNKVIVSARYRPVSRRRERLKYLHSRIVVRIFIRYVRSQFQKGRSSNSRCRCITGNYFETVGIIFPIGNIAFLPGIKVPIRYPVFRKIRMVEPIIRRMYGYFQKN